MYSFGPRFILAQDKALPTVKGINLYISQFLQKPADRILKQAKKDQEEFFQWNLIKFYFIAGSSKAD